MEGSVFSKEDAIVRTKALLFELEAGNDSSAFDIINELSGMREQDLYQGVGQLTRNLHTTVSEFFEGPGFDKFSEIDENEFPDALERLQHVITMTEESANTTLNVVEETIPLANKIGERGAKLKQSWGDLRSRKLTLEEFRDLGGEIDEYLDYVTDMSGQLISKLNEVLLAQGFQDLTGQMIKQVITLVETVEETLVGLIAVAGGRSVTADKEEDPIKAEGPALPSKESGVAKGQDDVDELLASLGF